LVEVLRSRAVDEPDVPVFGAWGEDDVSAWLSYGELDRRARAIAAELDGARGERALLLHEPGFDYIAALFGCFYGGVIAVPAYPPDPMRLDRTLPRLLAIIADAQVTVVLTSSALLQQVDLLMPFAPELARLRWIATDPLDGADRFSQPALGLADVAFLQYTSGSTGSPKGVRVTHGNLIANLSTLRDQLGHTRASRLVSWLPPYHDMGLVACILEPVFTGFLSVHMSPTRFLLRPQRWLEAMTRVRATTAGAPNFAFDLCVRKVKPEARARLDLSAMELLCCAAEPVRAETLARFAEYFAPCGFRASALYPCYGLAESTLIATGGAAGEGVRVRTGGGVSVGRPHQGALRIVDPERGTRLPDGGIGEIWLQSGSVCDGYWNRPEETRATFGATLAGEPGTFLRTGDLGRILDGELVVTGRLKELIIVRGRKHFPNDLESTVEHVHWDASHFRAGGSAAVSQMIDGEERLFLIVELERRQRARRAAASPSVERRGGRDRRRRPHDYREGASGFDVSEVVRSLRNAIAMHHGLEVNGVVLVRPGSIPKTSSGKKQRLLAREWFLAGGRPGDVLHTWFADEPRDKAATRVNLA
jgi:acyl-CoA synthetase (AMP-forming)/AMP-acid ligase II